MNSKDANELLTKDGSARVQVYRLLNLPFVFTMEMGYHGCAVRPTEPVEALQSEYTRADKFFSTEDYRQHGKSILVTLLSLFQFSAKSNLKEEKSQAIGLLR